MIKIKILSEQQDLNLKSLNINNKNYYFHLLGNQDNLIIRITNEEKYTPTSKIIGSIQVIKMKKESKLISTNSIPYGVKWIKLEDELRGKKIAPILHKLAIKKIKEYGGTHYCSDNRRSPDGEKFWTRNNISFYEASKRFCIDLSKIDNVDSLNLKE